MKLPLSFARRSRRFREGGLSLVEIMIATALLLLISLGLTAMFNQTQRAFRAGVKQVDVLAGGRDALDMISRDLEMVVASGTTNEYSLLTRLQVPRFTVNDAPDGLTPIRNNFLFDLFLLNSETNWWHGIGYRVLNPDGASADAFVGVGTLYRFFKDTNRLSLPAARRALSDESLSSNVKPMMDDGRLRRVIEGVVHLQLNVYNSSGRPFSYTTEGKVYVDPVALTEGGYQTNYAFEGTTLPALVELELGILEPPAYEQLKPLLSNETLAKDFIRRNSAKVHIFRKQIPVRVARQ